VSIGATVSTLLITLAIAIAVILRKRKTESASHDVSADEILPETPELEIEIADTSNSEINTNVNIVNKYEVQHDTQSTFIANQTAFDDEGHIMPYRPSGVSLTNRIPTTFGNRQRRMRSSSDTYM
jgi:hypothetical protein